MIIVIDGEIIFHFLLDEDRYGVSLIELENVVDAERRALDENIFDGIFLLLLAAGIVAGVGFVVIVVDNTTIAAALGRLLLLLLLFDTSNEDTSDGGARLISDGDVEALVRTGAVRVSGPVEIE